MGYKETANFNTRGDGSNFLVDLSQIALPAAGAAIGAFAGNPMLGYQVGNMGARAIAGNNQVSGGAQMANGLMGMGASFLGSGSNESVKANGGNIPQVMMYNGGGTHEQNPLGGIPVDGLGNPSMQSTALVEANEVGYKLPNDKSGYVFSDRIKYPGKKVTYSDEAKRILGRYKNRLGKDLDKPDALAKKSLDIEIAKLKEEQEYSKAIDQQQQQIKAYGGYLKKLAMGGPGEPPTRAIPMDVNSFAARLTGDVSDTTMYSPQAKNFPTTNIARDVASKYPGVFRGASPAQTIKGGQKAVVPERKDSRRGVTQEYSTDKDAIAQALNDDAIRRAANIDSYGQILNQFLPADFLKAGIDFNNNLIQTTGDTLGLARGLDSIAKVHPNRTAVAPYKVLNTGKFDEYYGNIQATQDNLQKGTIKNASKPLPLDAVKGSNETDNPEELKGKLLHGLRSGVAASPYAFKKTTMTDVTTPWGTAPAQVIAPDNAKVHNMAYTVDYTTPVVSNPFNNTYTGYVADKQVKNFYPGKDYYGGKNVEASDVVIDPNTFQISVDTTGTTPGQRATEWGAGIGTYSGGSGGSSNYQRAYGGGLPKYDGPSTATQQLPNNDAANYLKGAGYKEALTGYGMQAATRIPQLFTTPEKISYDRISPELIDLAQERANMQTSRNAQLGFLKRQASMAGSSGQALNYLGSAIPAAYNQYDQGYNQSIERESNANAQILNQANAQNAQIQMKEAEANAMEKDAARSIRDQAIADIGNISAQGYGLKSRLMQGYYGLKAQAATGDYGVSFDKNGQYTLDRRRDGSSPNTNFSGNYSLPIGLQPQFETPNFNIAGANKQLGYNPQSSLMGNKFKPHYQQTINPVTAPEPQLQLDNTDFYMPTEINLPNVTSSEPLPYVPYLEDNPKGTYSKGGKLCKGGYIKKKGKK